MQHSMEPAHRRSSSLIAIQRAGLSAITSRESLVDSFPFPEKFLVLHGYDCLHSVAESCTTTGYPRLFGDSHLSLVVCCFQVTKIVCSMKSFASASSARRPCNFGSSCILHNFQRNPGRLIFSLPLLSQDAVRSSASPNAAAARGDAAQAAFDQKLTTGMTCATRAFTIDHLLGQLTGDRTLPSLRHCNALQTSHPAAKGNRCRRNRFNMDGNMESKHEPSGSSPVSSIFFFCDDMMKAAREQSCTWWAPSAAQDKKKRSTAVRCQREEGPEL